MTLAAALLQADATSNISNAAPGYSVGSFTLALINAALAQAHGRSGLNWFLISVLFGPFATLVLVLQYKRP